jgi:hypothetical protein
LLGSDTASLKKQKYKFYCRTVPSVQVYSFSAIKTTNFVDVITDKLNVKQVNLSMLLIHYHVMKAYVGSEGIAPPFLTLALDRGKWSFHAPTALHRLPVPIGYEAVWVPEPVGRLWMREKSLALVENRIRAVQPVIHRYADSAIPAPDI